MAEATTTTFAPALKTLWPQKRYEKAVYENNPFLALVKKDEKFFGANLVLALRYADQAGRSALFATAQANATASAGVKFTLTRSKDYAVGSIDTETILASEHDAGALASALDTESSSLMNIITRSLAIACASNGTGSIGTRGSNTSSTTTMGILSDITKIEVGMKLTAHATDGAAARDTGAVLTVTAVDRDAGTFTYTGTISGYADADFLCVSGDLNAKLKGVPAWIPYTAPGATAFYGVDRTADVTRLAGVRMDLSSMNPAEGLVKFAYRLDRERGTPDFLFLNPDDVVNVQHELGSKVVYSDLKVGSVGFQAIKIHGARKPINLMSDANFQKGYGYGLQMDTWELHSLGKAPRMLNVDGVDLLRTYNADTNELRFAYYAALGCEQPGMNGVCRMPGYDSAS